MRLSSLSWLFLAVATRAVAGGCEALAQDVVGVSGRVTDSSGSPVAGAVVSSVGGVQVSVSDPDGRFSLEVPAGGRVRVSCLGFVSEEAVASAGGEVNFSLRDDVQSLGELVVIGYGAVRKADVSSSVSSAGADRLSGRPLLRLEQAIQGLMAGVSVRAVSGEPGARLALRVRGAASVNASTEPLIVVDGVPTDDFVGLGVDDIESVEVLKDAASAAIYGSRGSNGVVLITSRRAQRGAPKLSAEARVGLQGVEKRLDLLSASEWMRFRMKYNDANYLAKARMRGVTNAKVSDSADRRMKNVGGSIKRPDYTVVNDDRWFAYLEDDDRAAHAFAADAGPLSLLNWQDEAFRLAPVWSCGLSVSGGGGRSLYRVSGSFESQDGVVVGTAFKRAALRSYLECGGVGGRWTLGLSLSPSLTLADNLGVANGKDAMVHRIVASVPVSESGVGYRTNVEPNAQYDWAGSQSSPTVALNTNKNRDQTVRLASKMSIVFRPSEAFKVEVVNAAELVDADVAAYSFTSATSSWAHGEGSQSTGAHLTSRRWRTLSQVVADYARAVGPHSLTVMAGASRERADEGYATKQSFKNFANDAVTGSFDGAVQTAVVNVVDEFTPAHLASFFCRAGYVRAGRYAAMASLRYDGGSVFGQGDKWGAFPAISAAWTVSGENFWGKAPSWFNALKLRASYGHTGNNDISRSAAYTTLDATSYAGSLAYTSNAHGNDELSWERTRSLDIAMDAGFCANRMQVSVDWYSKLTDRLLYVVPVVGVSGFSTVWGNDGSIVNRGVDIEVTSVNVSRRHFSWRSSFSAGWCRGHVMSLGANDAPVHSGFNGVGDGLEASNVLAVGRAVNSFYVLDAIGVWRSQAELDEYARRCGVAVPTFEGKPLRPGDVRHRDVNADGNISLADDRVFLGQPQPKWTFGFSNSFSWGRWDASLLLTAQTGGKILGVLGRAIDRPGMGAKTNVMGRWRRAWWSEEEPGDGKTPYILSTTTGGLVDSRWLWNSDFLSVKSLSVGCTLPFNGREDGSVRLYLACENLLRFDSYYNGFSPEAANGKDSLPGGASACGLDYGGYPTARVVSLGLRLSLQ